MESKFLMALDGSEESQKAVKYLAEMTAGNAEAEITLFHATGVPPMLLEHGGGDTPAEEKKREQILDREEASWSDEERAEVENFIFGPALKVFAKTGGGKGPKVETKLVQVPHHDIARTILEEARSGGYDTVVVGRHGRSRIRELAFGGISSKIIQNLRDRTVWVVE